VTENEARPADVNLARIASALERIAKVADDWAAVVGRPTMIVAPPNPTGPREALPPEPRREFQFSASAGARLREGDKHDPEHLAVKASKYEPGLFCPTKLADGSFCKWKQAA
jgi:hypothetical protein